MTTLPIEVIVQDAEAPVVPGEDGTNTNTNTEAATVAVPNTGEGNGSIFSGSASAIVLPAILLVLALGTIVAMLIYKHNRQKYTKNKTKVSKKEKLAMAATSTVAVLAATVLVSNIVLPATKAATSDVTDGIVPAEDKVSIVVTRDGNSAEASIGSTATITSSSDFGYKILLSMVEGAETSNLYLDGDETSEYYIAPVEAEEGTELADNTWGYALEEGTIYNAVPLVDDAATVAEGDEPVEDEVLSIYYGVKVSSDLPAGTYSGGEIEYTLQPSTGFPDSLVYMQDMTPEICAAAPTPGNSVTDPVPTATLEDIRDHNIYTIAKLADGKCWMTQNLDLDLKTDGTITYDSTNTNLTIVGSGAYENGYTTENGVITWTPANATINFTGDTVEGWSDSSTAPYTANPGDVYYYTSGNDADDMQYNSLAECVAADHTAEDCRHYHAGNYYNWSAAIASNDSSSLTTQYDNAANSICPAGWKLPEGSNVGDRNYSGVTNLIQSYGILEDNIYEGCGGFCNLYRYLSGGFDAIRTNPLWLVRSGNFDNNGLSEIAHYGRYWLNTVYDENRVYNTYFLNTGVGPSNALGRSFGLSIRCMVQ